MHCETSLLLILTSLCLLNESIPILLKLVFGYLSKRNSKEDEIYHEILGLKSEQSKLSMQEQFAAFSKLQRKIGKLEYKLIELSSLRLEKLKKWNSDVSLSLKMVFGLISLIMVVYNRHTPICILDRDVSPFEGLLKYPISIPNAISPYFWVLISRVTIKYVKGMVV